MSKRTPLVILFGILALGAFLRFYQIAEVPLGLYPDEAMNGNNALEALATGKFKIFYPENNGREGLFINLQAGSLKLFGNEPWALRIVSAIFGTLTILGIYLVTKELFSSENPKSEIPAFGEARFGRRNPKQIQNLNDPNSKPFGVWNLKNWNLFKNSDLETRISRGDLIALLSSFFLATSYWHLNFSRIGFRAILLPLFATFGLYFLLKGLRQGNTLTMVLAGIFVGLGFYSYLAFRFVPFILTIPIIWYLWQWRKEIKNSKFKIQNDNSKLKIGCTPCLVALFVLITLVVSLPLILYFLQNPQDFIGRSGQVSIFSAQSLLKEFLKSNLATIGMFFIRGDCNWRHNFNCQAELNLLIAIFFIVGLVFAIRHVKHSVSNITLLGWFVFMTLPATLTKEGLPHALRSIGLIPPVMIFAGLGAYRLGQKILEFFEKQKQKWPQKQAQIERIKKELILLFILSLLLIPATTYRDYFRRWANNPNTYFAFSTDLFHLGKFLNEQTKDIKKYVMVNRDGVDIRGFPAPAQTVMFTTDTFREETRLKKNVVYVTRENWPNSLRVSTDKKTLILFLDGNDRQLMYKIQQQFSGFKLKVPGDFVVLQNY